ncbi:MAG: DUF2459 domain-containing protein [Planctomycetes bacterium]|nr:DUF2459 domain-containing protein [Planctomycetota bacterium]
MAARGKRSRRRWLLWSALLLLVACVIGGCTSTVAPPADPVAPTPVFILRDAMHVGVVLPVGTGGATERYVEYGFGDWSWYALGNDAWYRVFPTVLWPTAGALSRREFAATTPAELRRVASWVELDELLVGGGEVRALRDELDRAFAAGAAHQVWRRDLGMAFVPSELDYWLARTCADVAAGWLSRLGCQVGWAPIRASLMAIRPPR